MHLNDISGSEQRGNSLCRSRNCSGLRLIPFLLIANFMLTALGCRKDSDAQPELPIDSIITAPVTPVPTPFYGPTYDDNYTHIASWSFRSQWNLANVHDPTVEKFGDYYYMYQTNAAYGNAGMDLGVFPYRRSKNLVSWEYMGFAFSAYPAWVKDSLNNKRMRENRPAIANPQMGAWAPVIRKVGDIYRLYYSVPVFDDVDGVAGGATERAFIGLAESTDLATNNWVDKGMVVCSEPDGQANTTVAYGYYKFNAIDPTYIVTPEGEHWFIYGSWHTGIAALKVNPETGKPDKLKTIDDYGVRIAARGDVTTNRWQGLEGPEIIYNENTGYYYLFLAHDWVDVSYNTRVCRSRNITGPYYGIDGGNVTNGADCFPMLVHPYKFLSGYGWVGVSHCAIFRNPDTKEWFYSSQGRFPKDLPAINASNAVMMGHVRAIRWTEDGWPVLEPERYAGVPKTTITEASLVGDWEHLVMQYQWATQQQAVKIALTSDKKVTGAITGAWSYDAAKGILDINGTKLIVSDAWDWESRPRKVTITYTGLTSAGLAVWGKKIL
jgi:arabinan endo-1,5-alpha-L-arabinosidase